MRQCPQCNRTYAEDFAYCLEDGVRLADSRSVEPTLVLPEPIVPPVTPPVPSPTPTPVPTHAPQRSFIAVVLGVLGVMLIVIIWGGIKIGIWWLDHNQNNVNSNAAPSVGATTPSPDVNPLSLINSSPSPLQSPPLVRTEETLLSPGTYECETTRAIDDEKKHKAMLRLSVTLNIDGTYFQQAHVTIPEKQLDNLLGIEEKGSYSQEGDLLLLTDRRSREINFSTGEWQSWKVPSDGSTSREKIRNVTPNTFQLYYSEENAWFTFSRV